MTTKNQKLMLVSNFALRAKPHLGAINLSEMLNNKSYAFEMLIQATLTEDLNLIDLIKKVSNELNIDTNLINAVDRYIKNIKEINEDEEFLVQSKPILNKFVSQLYGIEINGATYREAVERLLLKVESDKRTFSINLARKFYPYCGINNRTIAKRKIEETSKLTKKNTLMKLWANLDHEFFYNKELSTLALYVEFMHESRYSVKDISISEKIAKIITIEIRNQQINPENSYRNAIDKTKILFDNNQLKSLFMTVTREYYNFWLGNIPKLWGYM